MFVASLGQPGLSVETDAGAEPSDTGGADFAALMAMAAAFLTPAHAPATPPTAPAPGGSCESAGAEALPAGAAASLAAFAWPGSGPGPMFAPTLAGSAAFGAGSPAKTKATTAAGLGQPDARLAPAPALVPSAPAATPAPALVPSAPAATPAAAASTTAEAGGPRAEAIPGMTEISGREIGPTGGTTRAKISRPSGETAADAAAVQVTSRPSPVPAEAAGETSADEAAGSKPVGTDAAGRDRLSAAHAHPAGPLLAAEVSRSADGPAASAPVHHPPVVDQVVSVVEPLRQRGDGHHELTLDLRPADLGPIRVEVSIERGTVHLSLHADQPSTGALLHQAMPELRAALEEAGLVAGRLGVGPGDREGGRPPAQSRPAEADEPEAVRPTAAVTALRPPVAPAAGALDVLL